MRFPDSFDQPPFLETHHTLLKPVKKSDLYGNAFQLWYPQRLQPLLKCPLPYLIPIHWWMEQNLQLTFPECPLLTKTLNPKPSPFSCGIHSTLDKVVIPASKHNSKPLVACTTTKLKINSPVMRLRESVDQWYLLSGGWLCGTQGSRCVREAGGDTREALREHPLHGHGDRLLGVFFFAAMSLMCESKCLRLCVERCNGGLEVLRCGSNAKPLPLEPFSEPGC